MLSRQVQFKEKNPTSAFFLETTILLQHMYFPRCHNKFTKACTHGYRFNTTNSTASPRTFSSSTVLFVCLFQLWVPVGKNAMTLVVWCHRLHAKIPVLPTTALHYQCKCQHSRKGKSHFRNSMKIVWPCELLGSVLVPPEVGGPSFQNCQSVWLPTEGATSYISEHSLQSYFQSESLRVWGIGEVKEERNECPSESRRWCLLSKLTQNHCGRELLFWSDVLRWTQGQETLPSFL